MHQNARSNYLETQVMTAPPERLKLMLIDAAIRNVTKAKEHWNDDDFGTSWDSISRAREIVSELQSGLNRETNPELIDKISAMYMFLFRELNEAATSREDAKLDGVLKVLAQERETWIEVCTELAKLSENENEGADLQVDSIDSQAPLAPPHQPPTTPFAAPITSQDEYTEGGFSLEG